MVKMSPLTRKLLRDLKSGWKSFAAIFIICSLAITLYVGIDATWRGIEENLAWQFEASNMADIFITGESSDRTVRDLLQIDGVQDAQRRVAAMGTAKWLSGEPDLALAMSDGAPVVSVPLVFEGAEIDPLKKNQCILLDRFAEAHGLGVGDSFRVKLDDKVISLEIVGLGVMPEYVVMFHDGEFSPAPATFGYAFVSPGTLSDIQPNELVLTLSPGADEKAVYEAVCALLADREVVIQVREDIFGIKMAMEEAQQIRAMGGIFPAVFFIIAALITWTTMSRLVENQRLQIGSLLSQGYGRGALTWHFALYGLLIAVLGCLVGLLGARYGIGPILMRFIFSMYVLPDVRLYMSPFVMVAIALVIMAITGGASVLSARSALGHTPAALLRPKPPGKGKRVFLENINWLWRRMRFSDKMIARNLVRSPVRLLMGVIGSLGCAALMLTGFGMRDSVTYVMQNHYTRTMHYEARVMLENTSAGYARSVAIRAGATGYEEEMISQCEVLIGEEWKAKAVYLLADAHDMIRLSDERGARVTLPEEGVALTRKAAEDYGMDLNDEIELRVPGGRAVKTRIVQIVDLQLDQGIYASKNAFKKLDLFPWMPTDVLLRGADLDLDAVMKMDGVSKVTTLDEERSNKNSILQIMNVIVLLLVLFSGALALVVFYNLGQLNFSERIRELATLKVLGFTPREIKRLVLSENIIIMFIGLPFGYLLGPELHRIVLTKGLPNTIQFVPYIETLSWVYTGVITVLFSLVVNWMLGAKFKDIDMVEALKSVE